MYVVGAGTHQVMLVKLITEQYSSWSLLEECWAKRSLIKPELGC